MPYQLGRPRGSLFFQTYPMGDGGCHLLIEFIQTNSHLFAETPANYLGEKHKNRIKLK